MNKAGKSAILNEVLSLNAQESGCRAWPRRSASLLNEVLSLNAQEFDDARQWYVPKHLYPQ